MKFIIAFSGLLAVAAAKPSGLVAPLTYAALPSVVAPVSSQFHSQDELGQYTYGYSNQLSAKAESRSLDGTTFGGYRYVDANGELQSVEYTSDPQHGFRVAASNLPVAPAVPEVAPPALPVPVQDTPEVAEARAKHLAALEEAKVRAAQADLEVKSVAAPILAPALPLAPAVALRSSVEPAVQVKSVEAPSVEVKSVATPAVELKSFPTSPIAIKSFVGPTISLRTPLIPAAPAFGYSYGINSLYGYNSLLAQPAITAYSVPSFQSHYLAGPVANTVVGIVGGVGAEQSVVAEQDKASSD